MTLSAEILSRRLSTPSRHLAAGLIVAAAILLRLGLDPFLRGQAPYLLYMPAVALVAWLCGVRMGLAATAVCAVIGRYLVAKPGDYLSLASRGWVAMLLFAGVGAGLVWLVSRWRAAEGAAWQMHAQSLAALEGVATCQASGGRGCWWWTIRWTRGR